MCDVLYMNIYLPPPSIYLLLFAKCFLTMSMQLKMCPRLRLEHRRITQQ